MENREKKITNRWLILGAVLAMTVITRFYKVTEPDHVCWDETHFGKMASWYINRTFFFDVHPPLGKMLIGLSGYLTGYDGTFPFEKPGDMYNGTRYEGMRYFCTTLGALVIPITFDTIYELTTSTEAALVASTYLLFDVGFLTLNQYILLDPLLLFFMTASIWGMVKISSLTKQNLSYTTKWWFWLAFTGTMLSCTISVKFVGLFVVIFVGTYTANELWIILGDLQKPVTETLKQFICRGLALIVLPCCLYAILFFVHLSVLNRSGHGDGFYSSAFQSSLIGNSLYNASMPREVAYGSVVTLKNHKTGGGYLHAHHHLYPKGIGARQQQVTSYTHKDDNNQWLIKHFNKEGNGNNPEIVRHGNLIRLEHLATRRNLHSHPEPAPITKKHFQVTGYGERGIGDANDVWRVIIVNGKENETLKTVTTKFSLIHHIQNCALTTSGKQLPKWGFEQQEVSCNLNLRDRLALWNVEDNKHKKLPKKNLSVYAPGYFTRFLESHAVMFQGNAGLKPKEGEVTSRPWQWPINYRGQFFSGSSYRVYLLGNPIIWWSNLIFLAFFIHAFVCKSVKSRRNKGCLMNRERNPGTLANIKGSESSPENSLSAASWLFYGWLFLYLPFWGMGRVLYFHHYFPALIFNSMLSGVMFAYLTTKLPKWIKHILLGTLLSTLAYSFMLFAPLSYGMSGPLGSDPDSNLHKIRWLSTWEF